MTAGAVTRPPALRPGDRVAVVSPSSPAFPDRLAAGLEVLRGWGLEPVLAAHARDSRGHLAGADADRAADLDAAFRDPSIRAVLASRGGYGALRIVDTVDWRSLADDPKPLVGFSDVTLLGLAAVQRAGVAAVHGQFVGRLHLQAPSTRALLHHLLFATDPLGALPTGESEVRTITPGVAEGPVLGGNLATICSSIGTPAQPDLRGAIVVLEEVAEAPYRLDRLLSQLRLAGLLDGVAGIVVGELVSCEPGDRPSLTADEVLDARLGDLGVPVLAGLPLGHVDRQVPVPLGLPARLDADAGSLEVLTAYAV